MNGFLLQSMLERKPYVGMHITPLLIDTCMPWAYILMTNTYSIQVTYHLKVLTL